MLQTSKAPLRGCTHPWPHKTGAVWGPGFHASSETAPNPPPAPPLFAPHDAVRCRYCGWPSTVPAGACPVCPNCGESTGCS